MSEHHTLVTMLFFILCASISLTWATPEKIVYSLEDGHQLFETFIKEYNKQYEGIEKEDRFQIFLDNLKEINLLNEESSNAVFGITKFTDLTKDEFIQTYMGYKDNKNFVNRRRTTYGTQVPQRFNYTAPDEFDWRTKGVVSRVKDQGFCTSWVFGVTGNVESINAIKTGKIVEISEQQIMDCDQNSGGCFGGPPDNMYSYLIKNGAMSSESYPYEAKDGSCRYNKFKVKVHVANYEHSQIQEQDIKEKLYKVGPLTIAFDGSVLRFYIGGIIVEGCRPVQEINSAGLLVGYGQEKGVDNWIIKYSWGESWGENGYFRMKRGVNCLFMIYHGVFTSVI